MRSLLNPFVLGIALTSYLVAPCESQAASRTVAFAGLSNLHFSNMMISNKNRSVNCLITIINSGTQDQIVESISLLQMFYGNNTKQTVLTTSNFASVYGGPTTMCTGCVGQTLSGGGGFCHISIQHDTIPWIGRIGICSGKITVKDASPSNPGSVVAAGSMFSLQEAHLLGGTLSGAYYASGVHVASTSVAGIAPASTPTSGAAPAYDATGMNMNHYCWQACSTYMATIASPWTDDQCRTHCGANRNAGTGDNGWRESIAGWVQPTGTITGNPVTNPIRYANPHFAGGTVFEFILGPTRSICSGNTEYFAQGSPDFVHTDGQQYVIVVAGNTDYPTAPPERLICSHRHAQDELTLGAGQNIPFTINGGNPF